MFYLCKCKVFTSVIILWLWTGHEKESGSGGPSLTETLPIQVAQFMVFREGGDSLESLDGDSNERKAEIMMRCSSEGKMANPLKTKTPGNLLMSHLALRPFLLSK